MSELLFGKYCVLPSELAVRGMYLAGRSIQSDRLCRMEKKHRIFGKFLLLKANTNVFAGKWENGFKPFSHLPFCIKGGEFTVPYLSPCRRCGTGLLGRGVRQSLGGGAFA